MRLMILLAVFAAGSVLQTKGYASDSKVKAGDPPTTPSRSSAAIIQASTDQGEQTPCDPLATSKVSHLLNYLRSHAYISGQTGIDDCEKVQLLTRRYPAICAFDGTNAESAITWAKTKRGIIAWQWHANCPYGGNYASDCDFRGDLDKPGSKLWNKIDEIMKAMKQMSDAGYPVIFRPLHESNNHYMWWTKQGSDAYKKLWRLFYVRARANGVHNLLWCFNGMASGPGANFPMKDFYPGDGMVDIISSDYAQSQSDLDLMKNMGKNKVVAIAETWHELNPADEPPFPYSVVWASRDWGRCGQPVETFWKTAMANPKTISIEQLPDMTQW